MAWKEWISKIRQSILQLAEFTRSIDTTDKYFIVIRWLEIDHIQSVFLIWYMWKYIHDLYQCIIDKPLENKWNIWNGGCLGLEFWRCFYWYWSHKIVLSLNHGLKLLLLLLMHCLEKSWNTENVYNCFKYFLW